MKTLEDRVADLEIRLCQSEDLVDELNRTVYRQQMQIERLAQMVGGLNERVETALPQTFKSLRDEIPPHY